jgi:hypothetical protein
MNTTLHCSDSDDVMHIGVPTRPGRPHMNMTLAQTPCYWSDAGSHTQTMLCTLAFPRVQDART